MDEDRKIRVLHRFESYSVNLPYQFVQFMGLRENQNLILTLDRDKGRIIMEKARFHVERQRKPEESD